MSKTEAFFGLKLGSLSSKPTSDENEDDCSDADSLTLSHSKTIAASNVF
jgi:hypothetical protein